MLWINMKHIYNSKCNKKTPVLAGVFSFLRKDIQ